MSAMFSNQYADLTGWAAGGPSRIADMFRAVRDVVSHEPDIMLMGTRPYTSITVASTPRGPDGRLWAASVARSPDKAFAQECVAGFKRNLARRQRVHHARTRRAQHGWR